MNDICEWERLLRASDVEALRRAEVDARKWDLNLADSMRQLADAYEKGLERLECCAFRHTARE